LISEEDAVCLRSLYTRLKQIFTDDPEYVFGIDDQQTREIHYLLDKTYEDLLTDGPVTDEIFKKPGRAYFAEEPLAWKNVFEDQGYPEPPIHRFRPYNMETRSYNNICHNQQILSNIDPEYAENEEVKELVEANEQLAEYLAEKDQLQPKRKGRPKKHDYFAEPIIPVKSLNSVVQILQDQAKEVEYGYRERVVARKITLDKSKKFAVKCTICMKRGKLLSCEECPVSYHPTCMGYDSSFPRRKWKCYFCKVMKYSLR
jgi:hypothetical protein